MDKQAAILEYLRRFHTGRNKAIYSRELQQLFDLDGRSLRRKISRLRKDGYPICSDENGYFFASCQSEINRTASRLNGSAAKKSLSESGRGQISPKKQLVIFIALQ